MNFVHLKTQTEYSINQSINKIDKIVKKAANNNMGAIGLSDINGLYGAINFYSSARKKGLKPIIGVDATIVQENGNTYQLSLIAKNDNGYKNLIKLNSKGYTDNRTNTTAFIKEEWLAEIKDIIVLSGAKKGLIGQSILNDNLNDAKEIAQQMKDFFGDDFYIELQRDGSPEEDKYMEGAVNICSELNIAPVATHPSIFTEADDFLAHEARYCIANKEQLFSIEREKKFNKEMYFKTQEEMSELFSDIPVALENTIAITKKCNLNLNLNNPKLPNFPTPNNMSANDYFAEMALKGLNERLEEDFENVEIRESKRKEYTDRLLWEIEIIQNMGFPGYFLIVADFINWAKENDIPVGPGRGSGAGSLVAYSMKITDLDPIPYGLYFERFLNPERVSMPDFDIDFCQSRRNEVYEYVKQKYGEQAVSQIGTFGTMASKAVVRDVGRTLGYPYEFVDNLAKLINIKPNNPVSLEEFIFGNEEKGINPDDALLSKYNSELDVKKLIDIALKLEGITRQVGTHAAGVVISPTLLTDFSPLYTPEVDGAVSTQFDKDDVEKAGLVKFDFLGLRTLTIIKDAVDLINKNNNNENVLINKLDLNDINVYKNIFWNGNTVGVFQFESRGMTATLQKAKPTILEDLMAVTAIYRPGPMEIISQWFGARALPENERTYPHELLKDTLQETAGFMIYQEQVMKCAQVIAGYSLGGADLLRRAMGKKKPEEMVKQRKIFVDGASKNNISEDKANELFDLMEKFAGYGFNKSHAAAYAYVSYQTAFLKAYYPKEFYIANLNSQLEDTDKLSILIDDAKKNKISILPPDVNFSFSDFSIESENIRYGLSAIKGVGDKAALAISLDREKNGPFIDFFDFLERVSKGPVNKRVLESLVNSGALDCLNSNRAQLKESLPVLGDYIKKYRKKETENLSILNDSLFDDEPVVKKTRKKKESAPLVRPELLDIVAWDDLNTAKNEKKSLGFFFTSNPFESYYSKLLGGFKTAIPLAKLNSYSPDNKEIYSSQVDVLNDIEIMKDDIPKEAFVGGIIEDIIWWKSKKGATVVLSDGTSTSSVMVFEDFLIKNKDWFKTDAFVAMRLKVQSSYDQVEDKESIKLSLMQGFNFEDAKKLTLNKIFIGTEDSKEKIDKIYSICNEYNGSLENNDPVLIICVDDPITNKKSKQVAKLFVKPDNKLIDDLTKEFGEEWVKLMFKQNVDQIVFPEIQRKNNKNYTKKK